MATNTLTPGAAPANPAAHVVNADGQFVLSPVPTNICPELAEMAAEYTAAFPMGGENAAENWAAAARRIREFDPGTLAELATKLMIGLHFRDPELCEGALAIDAPEAPHDRLAKEILLDCLDWIQRPPVARPSGEWEAAEEALRDADANLEALPKPYTDEDCDRLADIRSEAVAAILALPATTPAQALRKIELSMFDDTMVLANVDFPTVLAEARSVILVDAERRERPSSPGLHSVAQAWLDRWNAIGGVIGEEQDGRGFSGLPMPYVWTPPETHNPKLRPHEWIMRQDDHAGAAKMLESPLTLVPGLSDAVYDAARVAGLLFGKPRASVATEEPLAGED